MGRKKKRKKFEENQWLECIVLWKQSKEISFESKDSAFGAEESDKRVPGRNNSFAALPAGLVRGFRSSRKQVYERRVFYCIRSCG
jgi:hypothetical protein